MSSNSTFVFGPQSTAENLQSVVIVKTPGGVEVGRLTVRRGGEMQEWFFDKEALKTALTNRVYNSSESEITAAEQALVNPNIDPSLGPPSPQ